MAIKEIGTWNHGQKIGVGVFLFLMIVLKLIKENVIPEGWQDFATTMSCILAWQTVVVAYHRGWSNGVTQEGESK